MPTYRERREARAERLRGWAEKREAKATAGRASVEALNLDSAFNTQPGKVPGRARVIATIDRAHADQAKARSMETRAAGIEAQLAASIYSDDEDALPCLEEKLAGLEAKRAAVKAYNASVKRGAPDASLLDADLRKELLSLARVGMLGCAGGFPPFIGSNLSGQVARVRTRIEALRGGAA